jgi:hypothetical protein
MSPCVDEIIWSTATTAPGDVAGGVFKLLIGDFDRHALLVAFPNMHAAHRGILQFDKYAGRSPLAAICLIFANDECPNL